MKIDFATGADGKNRITSYSAGSFVVSGKSYSSSLILSSDVIIDVGLPADVTRLKPSDLDQILLMTPEVVLLGTGVRLYIPEIDITAYFNSRGVGFEVMDTGAACRAFNVLIAEDRRVVAVLFKIE
jgi:uncharacterized protein